MLTKLSINISAIMMNDSIRWNPDEVLMLLELIPDQYNITGNYTEICTSPGWGRAYLSVAIFC